MSFGSSNSLPRFLACSLSVVLASCVHDRTITPPKLPAAARSGKEIRMEARTEATGSGVVKFLPASENYLPPTNYPALNAPAWATNATAGGFEVLADEDPASPALWMLMAYAELPPRPCRASLQFLHADTIFGVAWVEWTHLDLDHALLQPFHFTIPVHTALATNGVRVMTD